MNGLLILIWFLILSLPLFFITVHAKKVITIILGGISLAVIPSLIVGFVIFFSYSSTSFGPSPIIAPELFGVGAGIFLSIAHFIASVFFLVISSLVALPFKKKKDKKYEGEWKDPYFDSMNK